VRAAREERKVLTCRAARNASSQSRQGKYNINFCGIPPVGQLDWTNSAANLHSYLLSFYLYLFLLPWHWLFSGWCCLSSDSSPV
jgi:hypothetical protein